MIEARGALPLSYRLFSFLKQGVTVLPRLILNLGSFCFSILSKWDCNLALNFKKTFLLCSFMYIYLVYCNAKHKHCSKVNFLLRLLRVPWSELMLDRLNSRDTQIYWCVQKKKLKHEIRQCETPRRIKWLKFKCHFHRREEVEYR